MYECTVFLYGKFVINIAKTYTYMQAAFSALITKLPS